jgi:hypothetical protein
MAGDREDSKLRLVGVAILATAIGGVLLYQVPLKSSRPAGTPLKQLEHDRVAARLWQDPFHAIDLHRKELTEGLKANERRAEIAQHEKNRHNAAGLQEKIHVRVRALKEDQRMLVLLVMLDGNKYQEGTEQRTKDRIAVLSALDHSCFAPETSDHIEYVQWAKSEFGIPYEFFQPDELRSCPTKPFGHVLVMWVNQDELEYPISDLREVTQLTELKMSARKSDQLHPETRRSLRQASPFEYKVIGPGGSETFRSMIEEVSPPVIWPSRDGMLEIYSPWVTVSSALLWARSHDDAGTGKSDTEYTSWVKKQLSAKNLILKHQIPSDFDLALLLVSELKHRGIELGVKSGQDFIQPIAIIAEWDTFYGRSLSLDFSAAACIVAEKGRVRHGADKDHVACEEHGQALLLLKEQKELDHRKWLRRYAYLRGLDGEIQGEEGMMRRKDQKITLKHTTARQRRGTGETRGLESIGLSQTAGDSNQ